MSKIIVLEFFTLDGVIQAPGGPEEDVSGNFEYGGWTVPYFDDFSGKIMAEQMKQPFSLLLGRKTFDIFASYWPQHESEWPGVNDATKFVVSHSIKKHTWPHSVFINTHVVETLQKLKQQNGSNLYVYGSGNLVQTLLKNDLIDELWLKIFPITIGKGKRLFEVGTIPVAFTLMKSKTTPSGVIFANFKRAGKIKTGTV